MVDAIHYCDVCGRLVHPSDLESGKALTSAAGALCPECVAKLPPEKRRELRGGRTTPPPPVRSRTPVPATRPRTPAPSAARTGTTSRREGAPRTTGIGTILVVSIGGGLLVGVAVVAAVFGGTGAQAPRGEAPDVPRVVGVLPPAAPPPVVPAVPPPVARPQPPAAAVDADAEYLEQLRALSAERQKRATPSTSPIAANVRRWDPAWELVASTDDNGLPGRSPLGYLGRENVMVTHPPNRDTSAAMTRQISIPAASRAALTVTVACAEDRAADWVLGVVVDGQAVGSEVVGRVGGSPQWRTFTFDLSRFAGRTVTLRVENRSGGAAAWAWEHGYWAEARVEVDGVRVP